MRSENCIEYEVNNHYYIHISLFQIQICTNKTYKGIFIGFQHIIIEKEYILITFLLSLANYYIEII